VSKLAATFTRLQDQVRDLTYHFPSAATAQPAKAIIVLLHGLGGDRNDWWNPFQERNWPYDHKAEPQEQDFGVQSKPPLKLPGIQTKAYLSPRLAANDRGADGSDDRSWWNALIKAGFPVITYSQVPDLMVPFTSGPVAQFKAFMETLQRDVLSDLSFKARPVVILGHSRGGLIGRAYLGDPEVKADKVGRFPDVKGLITLSSPHQGSSMALLDDRIIDFLNRVQKVVPKLPNDVGNELLNTLKAKADQYVGAHGDEIEPGSPLFRMLEAQEPIRPGVRCISVGGTSPRLLRVYLWTFTSDSLTPRKSASGKLEFHWRAKPIEAKGASPIPDGLPLKVLGIDMDEIIPGCGDGLTADKRCQFPPGFRAEQHLSFALSHAEELWDSGLQAEIVHKLNTFAS
jgi:pimeloyl-ACP methyl ester carboxylesterase